MSLVLKYLYELENLFEFIAIKYIRKYYNENVLEANSI